MQKSPVAQRLRQRCTCRADSPTASAASSFPREGCSWSSSTSRKRWTVWTATVRRDTVSIASCRKSSGKVERAGLGPGMAASFPCRAFWGVHLPLPKVCRIRDVICETDHLVSLAPGLSPVSRVAPPAPTGELLPSPIPKGKGQPSLTLHRYGVGVDCHSRFFQVCVLIPDGTELVKIERKVPALWAELRAARAWLLHTLREH